MAAVASLLFVESTLQNGERRAVLLTTDLFFNRHHRFRIKHPHAHIVAQVHLHGVRQEILVDSTAANHSEQIERAMLGAQIEVPGTLQVRPSGAEAPLRLSATKRVETAKRAEQTGDVLRLPRMNYVHVERGDRCRPAPQPTRLR
jgi:uncharacterized protein (UPF0212 family)